MKRSLKERIREFCQSLLPVVKRYPVEMALMLVAFVTFTLGHEKIISEEQVANLLLVPIFFTLAFVLNTRIPSGSRVRWVYLLSWLPMVPLWALNMIAPWIETPQYWIAVGVLCPLAVLMCRCVVENRSFVRDTLAYLASGVVAYLFVSVALGLFLAIYFSVVYIFHIFEGYQEGVLVYSALTAYTILQPLFFFALLERALVREQTGTRLLDILLNWIVTPALLIYTGILYLYALKITLTWTLPEGNVAYMVFGFTMLAILVKALRLLALKPTCDWFFSRFSLIALPALVLFWVGTAYRIGEYGLTEPRTWLVVCGGLMTACILLFLHFRIGRYLYLCAMIFGVFAAVTYVPSLWPEKIALRSQEARVERLADQLGVIGSMGRMVDKVERVDTADYKLFRRLYESAEYLYWQDDTVALQRILGVSDHNELLDRLPEDAAFHIRNGNFGGNYSEVNDYLNIYIWLGRETSPRVDLAGYKELFMISGYRAAVACYYEDDSVRVRIPGRAWNVAGDEFVRSQLRRIGCPEEAWPVEETLENSKDKFLRYETDQMLVLFEHISLQADSLGALRLDDVSASVILLK